MGGLGALNIEFGSGTLGFPASREVGRAEAFLGQRGPPDSCSHGFGKGTETPALAAALAHLGMKLIPENKFAEGRFPSKRAPKPTGVGSYRMRSSFPPHIPAPGPPARREIPPGHQLWIEAELRGPRRKHFQERQRSSPRGAARRERGCGSLTSPSN